MNNDGDLAAKDVLYSLIQRTRPGVSVLWRCRVASIPPNFKHLAENTLHRARPSKKFKEHAVSEILALNPSAIREPTVYMVRDAHELVRHVDTKIFNDLRLNSNVQFLLHSSSWTFYTLDIVKTAFNPGELIQFDQDIFHPYTQYSINAVPQSDMLKTLAFYFKNGLEMGLSCAVVACRRSIKDVKRLERQTRQEIQGEVTGDIVVLDGDEKEAPMQELDLLIHYQCTDPAQFHSQSAWCGTRERLGRHVLITPKQAWQPQLAYNVDGQDQLWMWELCDLVHRGCCIRAGIEILFMHRPGANSQRCAYMNVVHCEVCFRADEPPDLDEEEQ